MNSEDPVRRDDKQVFIETLQAEMGGNARFIAEELLGTAYSTWMGDLQETERHRFKFWKWVAYMIRTGNLETLKLVCRMMGCECVPLVGAKPVLSELSELERMLIKKIEQSGQVGRTFLEITDPAGDGGKDITPREYSNIFAPAFHAELAATMTLDAGVRSAIIFPPGERRRFGAAEGAA